MGRLISNSGLPEDLIPHYFDDIESLLLDKIEDSKCRAVIGAFPYLTSRKIVMALSRKPFGIVLSDAKHNYEIMKSCYPGAVDAYTSLSYKGISRQDLKGISQRNKGILEKTSNVEGTPFRFISTKQILINKLTENIYSQATLHAKMLGFVDECGVVYEWIVGGHNPTINGNNSLDCITSISDALEIEKFTHYWVYLWIESAILDVSKSPELQFITKKNTDEVTKAWEKAHLTYSKYSDGDSNDEYLPMSNYIIDCSKYIKVFSNRLYFDQISQKHGIPIGIKPDKITSFLKKEIKHISIKEHFPVKISYGKHTELFYITSLSGNMYIHELLHSHFFDWLEKHPELQKRQKEDKVTQLEQKIEDLQRLIESLRQ